MRICKDKRALNTDSGASLIATVLALLIFALFIAIAVSIITTGGSIGLQEEQGVQAFYVAGGGLQYAATLNFPNHDGGLPPVTDKPLGAGAFSLAVPALSADINNTVTDINVSSTDGFQTAPDGEYWIMLCDNFAGGNPRQNITALTHYCEKISFPSGGKTATSFTGGARGRHTSFAAQHLQNTVLIMYTWDTSIWTNLNRQINNSVQRLCVNSVSGFTIPGLIQIEDSNPDLIEDVYCPTIGTPADCSIPPACPGSCFIGCTRNAYSNGSSSNHNNGTRLYQSEISVLTTSTGTISNVLAGAVTRKVQAGMMPLQ